MMSMHITHPSEHSTAPCHLHDDHDDVVTNITINGKTSKLVKILKILKHLMRPEFNPPRKARRWNTKNLALVFMCDRRLRMNSSNR